MEASRQVMILMVFLSGIAGCASSSSRTASEWVKPDSIPAADSSEIGTWAERYQEILSWGEVESGVRMPEKEFRDFVLLYLSSNREFDSAEGIDGYVLQITPLGSNEKPRRFAGGITIFLQATPCTDASGTCPYLRVWRISPEQLGKAWRRTRLLDGYVLPLHWGERSLPEGNYRFQIVMESGFETQRHYAYRELTVSDNR